MRTSLGYVASFLYAVNQAVAEGNETTLSLLVLLSMISPEIAIALGLLSGVIEFLPSYYFQGSEIRKRITDENYESEDEETIEIIPNQVPFYWESAYVAVKYGYILFGIGLDYLRICLLYSAGKAWIEDLATGEETPLTLISITEGSLILLYYALFDLPLIFGAEMPETCKGIRGSFKILPDQAPDKAIMNALFSLVRPIAKNNFILELIRGASSLADTTEHVLPLAFIVPTNWIREIAEGPAIMSWGILGISSLTVIVISSTILAQTYLFEGKFIVKNLRSVASICGDETEEDKPWIHSKLAKWFHYLLYLGGPLHGIDTGLTISLALREMEVPDPAMVPLAISSFLIAWMGSHYSEVKESQSSLKKITLPPSTDQSGSVLPRIRFFAPPRSYSPIGENQYTFRPKLLFNYHKQAANDDMSDDELENGRLLTSIN